MKLCTKGIWRVIMQLDKRITNKQAIDIYLKLTEKLETLEQNND